MSEGVAPPSGRHARLLNDDSDMPAAARTLGPALRTTAGLGLGLAAGAAVQLGLLAYRAAVRSVYVHDWGDFVSWIAIPAVLCPILMTWVSLRLEPDRFWRSARILTATLLAGIPVGAVLGDLLGSHPADAWAGGYMGAGAAGGLVVAVLAVLTLRSSRGAALVLALSVALLSTGCGPAEPAPSASYVEPAPDSSDVESVVFLLGDPGMARIEEYTVLARMRRDVEGWSEALGPDGDVLVIVLGDIIYPDGLSAASDAARAEDSLRLADQIAIIDGPAATKARARMLFVAGNHDWGQEEDWSGAVRLLRLEEFLGSWEGSAAGRLSVSPDPGTGGPDIIDVGMHLRLVLLDTAWWLLGSDVVEKDAVIEGVRRGVASAGDRRVVIAAHHPLESGGPHGLGSGLYGLRFLLKQGGILLQSLDSRPYSDLKNGLLNVFAETGQPDVFAGGHEHSLQVFSPEDGGATRGLVVGSGSKLSSVSGAPGMLFGRSEPGYGRILILRDGSMHVELEAAPERFLRCDTDDRARCAREGLSAYETVWREEVPRTPAASSATGGGREDQAVEEDQPPG